MRHRQALLSTTALVDRRLLDVNPTIQAVQFLLPAHTGWADIGSACPNREFHKAQGFFKVLTNSASFFKTNDDLVGNAVEDAAVGAFYPGFNWWVKAENSVTNGWLKLEKR